MGNSLIIGPDGFKRLKKGYEINSNDIKVKAAIIAQPASGTVPVEVAPGDLLVTTAISGAYHPVTAAPAANRYVIGVALATNVKVDRYFPQTPGGVKFISGDAVGVLKEGEIAVQLHGTAPFEGAPVYFDFTNKAYTATSGGNVEVPGAKFTGRTENGLTVIACRF